LLLLGIGSQLQANLFSSYLAHFQAQVAKKFVFGFSLVCFVVQLLAHDCLRVFVDDLYQVDKLMEHICDFHDLLLFVLDCPSLANTIEEVEIVQNRIENKAEKDDGEEGVFQESLFSLFSVPVADVSEYLYVSVKSAFLWIFRFLKLVLWGFLLTNWVVLRQDVCVISSQDNRVQVELYPREELRHISLER